MAELRRQQAESERSTWRNAVSYAIRCIGIALAAACLVAGCHEEEHEAELAAGAPAGLRLHWLAVAPHRGGVRLAAAGAILGERTVGFATDFEYGHDDRLVGGARFDIPGGASGTERLCCFCSS